MANDLIEQIAQQWDGCMHESVGGDIDIGQAIRDAGKDLAPHTGEAEPVAVSIINGEQATALSLLDALIDIYDDTENKAPEHRCYVEGAWEECLSEARAFLAAPSAPPAATPAAPGEGEQLYRKVEVIRSYAYRPGVNSEGGEYTYWHPEYHPGEQPPPGWFRIDFKTVFEPVSNPAPVAAPALFVSDEKIRDAYNAAQEQALKCGQGFSQACMQGFRAVLSLAAPAPASEAASNPVADAMNDRRPMHEQIAELRRRERPSAELLNMVVGAAGDSADAPMQQAGALSELRRAVEFLDQCRAASENGEDVTGVGAFKDAREWLEAAARAALKGEQPVEPSCGERGEVK